ncbi:MAG: hypothetical protein ACRC91_10745, partial [Aeromonas sp.]
PKWLPACRIRYTVLKLVRGDDDTPNGVISCLLLVNQIAVFLSLHPAVSGSIQARLKSHEDICDEENTYHS